MRSVALCNPGRGARRRLRLTALAAQVALTSTARDEMVEMQVATIADERMTNDKQFLIIRAYCDVSAQHVAYSDVGIVVIRYTP